MTPAPSTPVEETVDDPAMSALRSVMSAKPVEKKPETPAKGQKKRPTKQTNANDDQQPQQAQESSDWKSVPTKKPRKLVLSSSRIARVIGRSGCNVNAIRDVTGTHIGKKCKLSPNLQKYL